MTAQRASRLRTPPDLTSPPRDELVMKVLVAARVPGTDAHAVITAHRVYLLELMQQWTRLKEGEARDDLALALVVDPPTGQRSSGRATRPGCWPAPSAGYSP
jgi:hypothetical protein